MTVSVIQAQVPSEIQRAAEEVLRAAGMTASDVLRNIMALIAGEKSVPLDLLRPNAETLEAFAEVERGELETITLEDLRRELREGN